jgi:tetratricopeptide (TPR) repeat protein
MQLRLFALPLVLSLAAAAQDGFELNHRLGESYISRGELQSAIPYLRRAYQIDPTNYNNGYDLALACLQMAALDEARRVIQDLLKRHDKSELHNLLGDVEEASGRPIEAVREYESAARMDPSEKNVFDLGSDLLTHQGFEQAVKVFEFGTGRYTNSARMHVGLGVAYYSLGRYYEAVGVFCAAVDLDPKDTRALDFVGKMHNVAPELDEEVTKRLARFAKLYPDNPLANFYYAVSLRNRASSIAWTEVEVLLLKALKLNPQLTDARYQLALLYEDEGHAGKAIREYEAVLRAQPNLKTAHYRLSRLYAANGRAEEARKELELFRSLQGK